MSKIERLNRAPVNKEILRVQLPRPTVVKLPNGLTVILIEDHKLPTVTFTMWISPGQLGDPSDLPGLASFTADMLREGTAHRTSSQIAAETDSLGATLNANAPFGASYTAINAAGLAGDAEHILDLMSDVVLRPAFAPDELAQYKRREEAALEQRLSNPGFLALQAMRRALYVEGPLSVSAPSKESVEKVTSEDLQKFHDQHYRPGNALFGVIGDFRTEDMRALVAKQFGAWAGAAEAPVAAPNMAAAPAAKITLVDRPGFGADVPARGRPDDSAKRSGLLCAGSDEPSPRRGTAVPALPRSCARSTAIPTAPTAASARRCIQAIGMRALRCARP